jgi:uncharacterized protein Usg
MVVLLDRKVLATVQVLYWNPDYNSVLQEFIWQTIDLRPDHPRIQKFLLYWKDHVEAIISEVNISDMPYRDKSPIRRVDKEWLL